ncbi:MAG: EamA family transporter [Clostridia bacterium]|nr:EamA family transporter [Clostridia bacterium]
MWFIFALVATLSWGCADLFYKKGADENDKQSHLKQGVWVGIIMGLVSFIFLLMPQDSTLFEHHALTLENIVKYSPASMGYILSMVIGYAGMRYLEISIISPVQNASGSFSAVAMLIFFLVTGKIARISDKYSALDIIGSVIIVIGVIALAIVEKRLSDTHKGDPKYRLGALALVFPLLYCLFDTIGTTADGIILDEDTGLGLTETDVTIIYGLTFFAAGVVFWIYMLIRNKKPYNPFKNPVQATAACFEELGQVFYVYAMARNPVLAAPMVASYCIVSVVLSRVFLKEKLKASQYACVISVIVGIVILGISEGLSEAE